MSNVIVGFRRLRVYPVEESQIVQGQVLAVLAAMLSFMAGALDVLLVATAVFPCGGPFPYGALFVCAAVTFGATYYTASAWRHWSSIIARTTFEDDAHA